MTAETATPISHAPTRRLALTPADVEEIGRQAAALRPADALQALVGRSLWLLGWASTKLFVRGWLILFPLLAWLYVAMRTGSREARGVPSQLPSVEALMDENRRLRLELERVSVIG